MPLAIVKLVVVEVVKRVVKAVMEVVVRVPFTKKIWHVKHE